MSKRNTGAAEAAIATENEHFNGYALAFLCKAKEGGKFPDLDTAMASTVACWTLSKPTTMNL